MRTLRQKLSKNDPKATQKLEAEIGVKKLEAKTGSNNWR